MEQALAQALDCIRTAGRKRCILPPLPTTKRTLENGGEGEGGGREWGAGIWGGRVQGREV